MTVTIALILKMRKQTQRDEVITQSHTARTCSQDVNPSSLAVEFVFMYGMYTISEQLADFI